MRSKVGAIGIVFDKEGRVLLDKRYSAEEKEICKWELPGGGIEFGETPEEAVIRELKEELNIDVEVLSLVPLIYSQTWDLPTHKYHVVIIPYLCRLKKGIPEPSEEEVEDCRYFDPKNIDAPVLPGTKEMVFEAEKVLKRFAQP